jgi:hypothetical protein
MPCSSYTEWASTLPPPERSNIALAISGYPGGPVDFVGGSEWSSGWALLTSRCADEPSRPSGKRPDIPKGFEWSRRELSRILDVDAIFVSLQKDVRENDRTDLDGSKIVDWTAEFADFADTAAPVSCLDLVITVDTSVAHLAAAMGCVTWVLLPYTPDYRRLLDRDDSPWYPTMRLFRQSETREYGTVLDRVRGELLTLISAK